MYRLYRLVVEFPDGVRALSRYAYDLRDVPHRVYAHSTRGFDSGVVIGLRAI